MSFLTIQGLKKSFGELDVLHDISFTVEQGDVIAVIGSSGSGKSTLLRCLIDLETVDGGNVTIDGESYITQGQYPANAHDRRRISGKMGMVFQNFNLFPHMTVGDNLIKPYLMTTPGATDAKEKCEELLRKVGLWDKVNEYPSKLSGGQKQRVAIARALMKSPEIMLFDEPTSALDPQLTGEVLSIMQQLAAERMTMLVVTHEMSFAKNAANRVVFMKDGKIAEEGPPEQIFENPQNPDTAAFLGTVIR
ncbi:MAG: amino acid ABC transporter ATP-binding protein [Angelakisella sp.]|nr:amino acid ABC transporter ATP-binding protein [Angelakisella sp.]